MLMYFSRGKTEGIYTKQFKYQSVLYKHRESNKYFVNGVLQYKYLFLTVTYTCIHFIVDI